MIMKMNNNSGTSQTKNYIFLTAILFVFWVLLSGKMEAKYLTIGFITAVVSAWVTLPLLRLPSADGKGYFLAFDFAYFKYLIYWFWLLKEIIKANIDIALVVLNPKLPINPQVVQFKRPMSNPLAHVTLANSITLTPGTITMDVKDGVYTIHALTDGAAQGLGNGQGEMMVRVSRLFNEETGEELNTQREGEV
ncbi:MAG: multicomponent Na+:H+ antiporter subunit [Clostridia bacterium]|jgi:multicomponent Na+:H+ antiporter subunit E|nr:multicomponent Na+:H+ antiporter subunit [Clostridia bacterium]MDN5323813.1 multicomponent Na+:H+ antiporter subunit [Clostridia bacterium]